MNGGSARAATVRYALPLQSVPPLTSSLSSSVVRISACVCSSWPPQDTIWNSEAHTCGTLRVRGSSRRVKGSRCAGACLSHKRPCPGHYVLSSHTRPIPVHPPSLPPSLPHLPLPPTPLTLCAISYGTCGAASPLPSSAPGGRSSSRACSAVRSARLEPSRDSREPSWPLMADRYS